MAGSGFVTAHLHMAVLGLLPLPLCPYHAEKYRTILLVVTGPFHAFCSQCQHRDLKKGFCLFCTLSVEFAAGFETK